MDACHSGDYARAYAEVSQAHAHMFEVAEVHAAAFVAHHLELFELPHTSALPDTSCYGLRRLDLRPLVWIPAILGPPTLSSRPWVARAYAAERSRQAVTRAALGATSR